MNHSESSGDVSKANHFRLETFSLKLPRRDPAKGYLGLFLHRKEEVVLQIWTNPKESQDQPPDFSFDISLERHGEGVAKCAINFLRRWLPQSDSP